MKKLLFTTLLITTSFLSANIHPAYSTPLSTSTRLAQNDPTDNLPAPQQVQQVAKNVTVRITSENNGGSGVIIAKKGDSYLILTNAHVVRQAKSITIQAPDGQKYQAKSIDGGFNTKYDLALLQFTSKTKYALAKLEDRTRSTIEPTRKIYSSGFPFDSKDIRITSGEVSQLTDIPFDDGTQIGYVTNKGEKGIRQGMSGGAIFDVQGNFLGINTVGIAPILPNYTYNDGSKPSPKLTAQYTRANWGIPVYNFLTHVKADILYGYDNLPKVVHQVTPTGYTGGLNNKARKMTVRIENSDGNGSGVIVAKEGNSYYVLTAKHVVQDEKNNTHRKSTDGQIITYDQDSHPVTSTIVAENVDLAVIKFTSSSNYPLAKLGGYNTKDDDLAFVGGFPGRDKIKSPLWQWQLNPGYIFSKETGKLRTQTDESFSNGYDLIYGSISYEGMSGGPVFDTAGNVIGIHGRGEAANLNSLGMSIQTFIGLARANKLQIAPNLFSLLTIAPNRPSNLSTGDRANVISAMQNLTQPQEGDPGSLWLDYGNQLYRSRQYDKSVVAFDKAIANSPQDKELLIGGNYGKAMALYKAKKFKPAATAIERAIAAAYNIPAPKKTAIYYYLWNWQSTILRQLDKYDEALKAIDIAIALNKSLKPKDAGIDSRSGDLPLRHNKATILSAQRNFPAAIAIENDLIRQRPEWYFYAFRAMNKSYLGDIKGAIEDYNLIIKDNPSYEVNYVFRAQIKSNIGDRQGAMEDLDRAIKLNPNSDWVYERIATIKLRGGDSKGAMQAINIAIKLNPEENNNYDTRADIKRDLNDYKGAIEDTDRAIRISPSNYLYYSSRGNDKIQLNDYRGAIADYNKSIQLYDNQGVTYAARGLAKLRIGDKKGAMEDVNQGVKIYPSNPEVYSFRGKVESKLGDNKAALKDYDLAIELMPNRPDRYMLDKTSYNILYSNLYSARGEIKSELGDYKGGIEDENRAIELNSKSPFPHHNKASIKSKTGDRKGAIADWNIAIRLDPKNADYYIFRGSEKEKIGDNQGAIDDFTQAIKFAPKLSRAYGDRGIARYFMGDNQGAIDDFTQAIKFASNNDLNYALNYSLRGLAKSDLGDKQGAIDDYDRAIKIDPNNAINYENYSNRGNAKLALGDKNGAVADYNKSIELNPKYALAYASRGGIKYQLGDNQGAISDYTQAIKLDPKYVGAYFVRGLIKSELGNKQSAILDYNKAIELNPKNENVYISRGVAKFELGDNAGAITDTNTALKLNPQNASSYANRGAFKIIDNKEKEALPDLEQAIKLDPKMSYAYAGRGIVKETLGDKQGAILDYKQALKLNPQLINEWKKQAAFIQKYNTASYQKYQQMIQKLESGSKVN